MAEQPYLAPAPALQSGCRPPKVNQWHTHANTSTYKLTDWHIVIITVCRWRCAVGSTTTEQPDDVVDAPHRCATTRPGSRETVGTPAQRKPVRWLPRGGCDQSWAELNQRRTCGRHSASTAELQGVGPVSARANGEARPRRLPSAMPAWSCSAITGPAATAGQRWKSTVSACLPTTGDTLRYREDFSATDANHAVRLGHQVVKLHRGVGPRGQCEKAARLGLATRRPAAPGARA